MSRCRKLGRFAAALLVVGAASGAFASDVEIAWDPELAYEHDRENYQRTVRAIVERSRDDVAAALELRLARAVKVNVLTPARYEARFGSGAAWTQGARYQGGAIHVNGGKRLDDQFAGTVVHEMTHAFLDHRGTAGLLPTWFNEGMAERLSWKRRGLSELAPNQVWELKANVHVLRPLPANHTLTPLGYLQAYAAVLFLEKKFGWDGILAVARRTIGGETFERALDAELRTSVKDVERGFIDWVDHL